MQKAYDDWLRSKAGYNKAIEDGVNGIKERNIPEDFNQDDKERLADCEDEVNQAADSVTKANKDLQVITQLDSEAEERAGVTTQQLSDAQDADIDAVQLSDVAEKDYNEEKKQILAEYERKMKQLNDNLGKKVDAARTNKIKAQDTLSKAKKEKSEAEDKKKELNEKVDAVKNYYNLLQAM